MDSLPTFESSAEGARAYISWQYDQEATDRILKDIDEGVLRLIPDPEFWGVWGVAQTSDNKVLAILYLKDADSEESDDFVARYFD